MGWAVRALKARGGIQQSRHMGRAGPAHYAFLVSEAEFDEIVARINKAGWTTGPTRSIASRTRSTPTTAAAACIGTTRTGASWRSSPGPTAAAAAGEPLRRWTTDRIPHLDDLDPGAGGDATRPERRSRGSRRQRIRAGHRPPAHAGDGLTRCLRVARVDCRSISHTLVVSGG